MDEYDKCAVIVEGLGKHAAHLTSRPSPTRTVGLVLALILCVATAMWIAIVGFTLEMLR